MGVWRVMFGFGYVMMEVYSGGYVMVGSCRVELGYEMVRVCREWGYEIVGSV